MVAPLPVPSDEFVTLPERAAELGLTHKQQKFAELYATGMPPRDAFINAGYSLKSVETSPSAPYRTLRTPKVMDYIAALNAAKRKEDVWTREDLARWCMEVITTPISDIADARGRHQLAEGITEGEKSTTYRMPSKMAAAQLLARICGYLEHEQHKTVDVFIHAREQLRAIRRGEDPNETIIDAEVSGA